LDFDLKNVNPFISSKLPLNIRYFNDRASPYIGSHSFGHNSRGDWARELSKPSTHSARLRLEIEKNAFFRWGVFWR